MTPYRTIPSNEEPFIVSLIVLLTDAYKAIAFSILFS
ncbi:hypothetical protein MAN88_02840 [Microcystis aeruginosa]|nr:hypothetical protein MAN88_02840 [Microcystis aeruginosa]